MMSWNAGATIAGLVALDGLGGKLMEMLDRNAGATIAGLVVPDGMALVGN